MRYFYMEDGVITEYLGMTKSNAEMAGYANYEGTKSADWLKLDEEGKIVELTEEEYKAFHPFDPTKHIFSKYRVKQELQAITTANNSNLWADVKANLTPEQHEDMMLAQDYNLADDGFMMLYTQISALGVDIDTILEKCILQ